MQRRRGCRRRHGFTMLELLIVMAIILILVSLTVGTVFKVYAIKDQVEARRELAGLESAIKAFAADPRFGQTGYIPSRLDPSGSDPLSQAYLRKLFPRTGGGIRLPKVMLEGQEVMVLMLNGPSQTGPSGKMVHGWSTNPQDPCDPNGQRIKFYEFAPERLQDTNKGTGEFKIYRCLDKWGSPIAYFSPRREFEVNASGKIAWASPRYSDDCPSCIGINGGGPPLAYASQNLTTFQIVSAGKDGRFGSKGNVWNPGGDHPNSPPKTYPRGDPGNDDYANFSPRQLGNVP